MTPSPPSLLVPSPRGSGLAFVTGAGGFIGRHAASAFREAGWTVAGFGPAPRFDDVPELLQPHRRFEGRVSRQALEEARSAFGAPDVIVHAAGSGSVGPSLVDPDADYARNVGSLEPVLQFMQALGVSPRLVYLSSAAVYGAGHDGPIPEDAQLAPISPYGRHKRLAEEMVTAARQAHGLDTVTLRLFSVYGPGVRKQLLWDMVTRLRAGESPLRLGGTGEEQRDFLHVDDAVRLIGLAASAHAPPAMVNGGAGEAITVATLAVLMRNALSTRVSPARIAFAGETREGDPASLVADISLATGLGFAPSIRLADGVADYGAWARSVLA